jgi:hypothetical protein
VADPGPAGGIAVNLYPWDVDSDPAAAERIAGLGVPGVTLAAAYHAVRAVTPYHPRHRIVTTDAAVYYQADPAHWRWVRLRPPAAPAPGSFERAAAQLTGVGLRVTAWLVVTHNARLGAAAPDCTVRNAFGDRYPWALCIASPEVREYAAALAAEAAALPGAGAVELEACGWYGMEHGSAHDKTQGSAGGAVGEWLLSLCFCPACVEAYASEGADPDRLRIRVRQALDAIVAGDGRDSLSAPDAGLLASVRAGLATRFRRDVIAAARAAAPGKPVYVHAHPDARACGANPGCDPAALLGPGGAGAIVLSCWDPATAPALVARTVAAAPPGAGVVASLLAVSGLGGDLDTLPRQADAVQAAGATGLRLYHAGLARPADLAAIRSLCARDPSVRDHGEVVVITTTSP